MGHNKVYRQILVAIIANISSIAVGTTIGWSSPNIPKLQGVTMADTPLDHILTASEAGWVGSLVPIGGAISPIFAGPLSSKFGRKFVLIGSVVIVVVSYTLLGVTNGIALIYSARFLQGCSVGLTMSIMPMYIGEISQNSVRGALGTFMIMFMNIGILFAYSVAPFVPYVTFQFICYAFPILFVILFVFVPESPTVHLIAGNTDKAIKSLVFLRGGCEKDVYPEIEEIQKSIIANQNQTGNWRSLFTNRGNLRALLTITILLLAQQFSGGNAVLYYAQNIFIRAGGSFKPEISSIITSIMSLAGCCTSFLVVERFGRKNLLLVSGCGMATGTLLLSVYFFLDANKAPIIASLGFLPVVSLVLYLFTFYIGFGPLPWAMLGEMFPPDVKNYAAMIVSSLCSIFAIILLQFFEIINEELGPQWAFLMFTIFSIFGVVVTGFFVIETKGLSLQQILDRLNKK